MILSRKDVKDIRYIMATFKTNDRGDQLSRDLLDTVEALMDVRDAAGRLTPAERAEKIFKTAKTTHFGVTDFAVMCDIQKLIEEAEREAVLEAFDNKLADRIGKMEPDTVEGT